MQYPLAQPSFGKEEIDEVKKVLASGWVASGPKVADLERKVRTLLHVKHAIATTNCTSALHIALLAVGIKPKDEVIVADYTFPATGHAVLYCGAVPRFIDVDPETYNLDPSLIPEEVRKKTRVIIPVHTFGQPADMAPIMEYAKKFHLRVIEDAACALGAKYNGQYAGTIGDVGCFSLHARKGFTSGEGGLLVTNNDEIASQARSLMNFGISSAWDREGQIMIPVFEKLGFNYKMSDITAAIACAQLSRFDEVLEWRRVLGHLWTQAIGDIQYLVPPKVEGEDHIYQSYVPVTKFINRNKLILNLRAQGIQAQIGTYASHMQPVYNSKDKCPVSMQLFDQAIALPIYSKLIGPEIEEMASKIQRTIKGMTT